MLGPSGPPGTRGEPPAGLVVTPPPEPEPKAGLWVNPVTKVSYGYTQEGRRPMQVRGLPTVKLSHTPELLKAKRGMAHSFDPKLAREAGKYQHFKGDLWLDPKTGVLYNFDRDTATLIPTGDVGKTRPGFTGVGDVPSITPSMKDLTPVPALTEREKTVIRKKHLDEATAARETEREAGETVHTLAWHIKQGTLARTQESKGGKAFADMSASERRDYTIARKRGLSVADAAKKAVTPVLPTMRLVDDREAVVRGKKVIVRGKEYYNLDKIAASAALTKQFIEEVKGGKEILIERRRYSLAQAHWEREVKRGALEVKVKGETMLISAADAAKIKEETPNLHKILVDKGYDAYIAAIDAYKFEVQQAQRRQVKFEKVHTQLDDGNWVNTKWLADLKKSDPIMHHVLTVRGVGAAEAKYKANVVALAALDKYTDKEGGVDAAKFLWDNPGAKQTLKDAGFTPAQILVWKNHNTEMTRLIAVIEEGKLTPLQAETLVSAIAAAGFRRKTPIGTWTEKSWNTLTNEEKAQVAMIYESIKPSPIHAAELIIPGVYVARNWTTLTTEQRALHIAIDVASVLVMVGIFKVAGVVARATSGAAKITKLAVQAGKVGATLRQATKAFATYQKIGKMGSKTWIKHANKVTTLRQASMKADRLFLESLQRLRTITPRQLKQLAKVSDMRGIDRAIMAVSKAEKELESAWRALSKLKYYPNPKTAKQIAANKKYLEVLAKVERAQVKMQLALSNAGSTLQPRYTPSPEAPEFKGYRVKYSFMLDKKPIVGIPSAELDKTVANIMAKKVPYRYGEPLPQQVAQLAKRPVIVAEKPKFAPLILEKGKAVYAKPKPKPKPKPTVPTVEEFKRQVAATFKKVPKFAPAIIPSEAFGRMTYAQIAKHYGIEELVDADARSIERYLVSQRIVTKMTPATKRSLKEIVRAATQAQIKAMQKALTASQTRALMQEAVGTRVMATPALAPAVKPVTKQIIKTATKTTTKAITAPKIAKAPIIKMPKPILRPRPDKSDKEKRKAISKGKGAFAFRMGEVGEGKDVWYTYVEPYNKPEHRIVVIGKAPKGALVVRGPGSAIKTAQVLRGKALAEKRTDDIGFMDAIFEPILRRKGIRLSFKPDPKGETIGDFGTPFRTTDKAEPITPRVGSITERRGSISGGRGIRITPKVGKLR